MRIAKAAAYDGAYPRKRTLVAEVDAGPGVPSKQPRTGFLSHSSDPTTGWHDVKALSLDTGFVAIGFGTIDVKGAACVVESGGQRWHGIPIEATATVKQPNDIAEGLQWFDKTDFPDVKWPFVSKMKVDAVATSGATTVDNISVYQSDTQFCLLLPKMVSMVETTNSGNSVYTVGSSPSYDDTVIIYQHRGDYSATSSPHTYAGNGSRFQESSWDSATVLGDGRLKISSNLFRGSDTFAMISYPQSVTYTFTFKQDGVAQFLGNRNNWKRTGGRNYDTHNWTGPLDTFYTQLCGKKVTNCWKLDVTAEFIRGVLDVQPSILDYYDGQSYCWFHAYKMLHINGMVMCFTSYWYSNKQFITEVKTVEEAKEGRTSITIDARPGQEYYVVVPKGGLLVWGLTPLPFR